MCKLTEKMIREAVEELLAIDRGPGKPYEYFFFTGGTGVPDDIAIDYFKDTNITVITRNGKEFFRGEEVTKKEK